MSRPTIERDGQVVGHLAKVAVAGYGAGLAATTTRTRWDALKLDGRKLTSGRTQAEARQNFLDVLDEAERIRQA